MVSLTYIHSSTMFIPIRPNFSSRGPLAAFLERICERIPLSATSRPKCSTNRTLFLHIVRPYPISTPIDFGPLDSDLPLLFFLFNPRNGQFIFLVLLPQLAFILRGCCSRWRMEHGGQDLLPNMPLIFGFGGGWL
jgi:hypothetical protein